MGVLDWIAFAIDEWCKESRIEKTRFRRKDYEYRIERVPINSVRRK